MTDPNKLNSQIATLEASIAEKTVKLKAAQAAWEDWRAGKLRATISRDQQQLLTLKAQRARLAPMPEKKSSSFFYGSNQ